MQPELKVPLTDCALLTRPPITLQPQCSFPPSAISPQMISPEGVTFYIHPPPFSLLLLENRSPATPRPLSHPTATLWLALLP